MKHLQTNLLQTTLLASGFLLLNACGGGSTANTNTPNTNTTTPAPLTITHNGTTYGTVTSPFTGKVWLDRNLGAARVCEQLDDSACFGDYYQWGRNFDGHQDSTSDTIAALATNVNSTNNHFILSTNNRFDWAATDSDGSQRSTNWSKTDGSSICPVGFRMPTIAELNAELFDVGSAQIKNGTDAFSSFLKFPSAGGRVASTGLFLNTGTAGDVWANSVNGGNSLGIFFDTSAVEAGGTSHRANGLSVRCLKN